MHLASFMIAMTALAAEAAQPLEIQNRYAVVTLVDGVGSYRKHVTEAVPPADEAHELAREAESWYRFRGAGIGFQE